VQHAALAALDAPVALGVGVVRQRVVGRGEATTGGQQVPPAACGVQRQLVSQCGSMCVFGGTLNWLHLAHLESGVGGAIASPGPVRVWGGWGCSLTWPS